MSGEELNWSLRMSLIGPRGERVEYALSLAEDVASDLYRIKPPDTALAAFGVGHTFDQVVEILRRREFRKSLFIREAGRLGTLLAERMEDAEGWHDVERIEAARKQIGWKP